MSRSCSILISLILTVIAIEAFSTLSSSVRRRPFVAVETSSTSTTTTTTTSSTTSSTSSPRWAPLFAEPAAEEGGENAATEEAESTEQAEGEEIKEEEKEEEDPELTALKGEIAKFEKELSDKQNSLQTILDDLDLYSKSGYTRRVAQIENLRRSQESLAASTVDVASGLVLKEFLPALDRLKVQKLQYADNEFGQNYAGLTGAMETALESLGLQEFYVEVGAAFDVLRMNAVEKKHSEEFPADTVMECLRTGYQAKGEAVLRPAECVVSLGKEGEEAPPAEGEAPAAEEEAPTAAEA